MGISTFTSKEVGPFFAGYLADWQAMLGCPHFKKPPYFTGDQNQNPITEKTKKQLTVILSWGYLMLFHEICTYIYIHIKPDL